MLLIIEYKKNNSETLKDEKSNKKEESNGDNNNKNIEKENQNEIGDNKNEEGDIIVDKEFNTMNKKLNIKKVIRTFRFWRHSFILLFLTSSFFLY